jgi:peroxiredoxin
LGDLAAVQAELAAQGVGMAAISVDEPADSRALAESLGLEFPLLSDPEARVITAYGVKMDRQVLAVPATFVLRADRTIAWQYVGEAVPDRPPIDVVREEARRLR